MLVETSGEIKEVLKVKKVLTILLAVFLCASSMVFQGCEDSNVSDDGNNGLFSSALDTSDLSIDDFEWETKPSKHNGEDCYSFSMVNNSDYDVIAVEFTYKVKSDANDTELEVYKEFMGDHEGYIEETDSPKDVILRGSKNTLVSKGEKLTNLRFTIGFKNWSWYDYPTEEQFNLMEPKEMQIGIVGEDNKLYIAYYDFEDNAWMLDEKTQSVDIWSTKEIAKKISKPAESHHIVITDQEDRFKANSYGITDEEYNQYIEDIKALGFKEEDSSSSFFTAKNADGYTVDLWYYSEDGRMSIGIGKEE